MDEIHDGSDNRIKELRDIMGWSQQELADRVGTSNQQIGRLEKGGRELMLSWMRRLAKPFNVSATDLVAVASSIKAIRISGSVQAGIWGSPIEDIAEEPEFTFAPVPDVYMQFRPFALKVKGPSMNRIYPEGTILICCHLEALREIPVSGKRYIIEDMNPHGEVEVTVKECVIDEGGRPWAWPRSDHPDYQEPIALDKGRNGHTIQAKSRVIFSMKPE